MRTCDDATGYLSGSYAKALCEFGTPRYLPRSGGWILERQIKGTDLRDAMGPYPLFACRDWTMLHRDLEDIGPGLVSLSLVTDPFGDHSRAILERCFPDKLNHFKDHLVTDLTEVSSATVPKHHRYYARRALRQLDVDAIQHGAVTIVDEWVRLYATLTERHSIVGLRAFSQASFTEQLLVPGIVVFRAREHGKIVGAHLWYIQGDVAYSHLAAVSERGYDLSAAYALYSYAVDYFHDKVRWLDLGGGAGASASSEDGLTRFKRGWASGSLPVWLGGRIFDQERYARLSEARMLSDSLYFPAYRSGEFG